MTVAAKWHAFENVPTWTAPARRGPVVALRYRVRRAGEAHHNQLRMAAQAAAAADVQLVENVDDWLAERRAWAASTSRTRVQRERWGQLFALIEQTADGKACAVMPLEERAAAAGIPERTYYAKLHQLREAGHLAVIEPGSTPATRPMALAGEAGNRGAVYALTRPRPQLIAVATGDLVDPLTGEVAARLVPGSVGTPSHARRTSDDHQRGAPAAHSSPTPADAGEAARAPGQPLRLIVGAAASKSAAKGVGAGRQPDLPVVANEPPRRRRARRRGAVVVALEFQRPPWGDDAVTVTRIDELRAAVRFRELVPELQELSAHHVRHLLRPFLERGWTLADLLELTRWRRDGKRYGHTHRVRYAAHWWQARAADYLDGWGRPIAPPKTTRTRRAAAQRDADARGAAVAREQLQRTRERNAAATRRIEAAAAASGVVLDRALRAVSPPRRRVKGDTALALLRVRLSAQLSFVSGAATTTGHERVDDDPLLTAPLEQLGRALADIVATASAVPERRAKSLGTPTGPPRPFPPLPALPTGQLYHVDELCPLLVGKRPATVPAHELRAQGRVPCEVCLPPVLPSFDVDGATE